MQSLVGQDVGRYHIVDQLGEGGMATVYKAYDNRLERNVAIKVIRSDQKQDTAFHRRFEREAKSLAQLSHTNIVKVLDYGEYEDEPYVVMEYLPGGTLKQKLGKPMDYRQAAKILSPVARALEYAHLHKIIHRDVKPANILLSESGQPMLSDFGIAKILEAEGMTQLTSTGVGIGTPEYMAPEQGFGRAIDQRADVYALGVVFYELVTGKRPFLADTPLAVLMKHMTDPLPPPRDFVPGLPEVVEKVIFKAMAKKPENRFQDMGAFASALESLALGQGVSLDDETLAVAQKAAAAPATGEKKWLLPVGIIGGVVVIGLICLGLGALGVFGFGKDLFGIGNGTEAQGTPGVSEQGTPGATALPGGVTVSTRQKQQWGTGMLNQAAFTPDGKRIIVATTLGLDELDTETLEVLESSGGGTYMSSLAVSPDGETVAGLTSTGSLQIWDLGRGELARTLEGYKGTAGNLAFSPDGRWLACASGEGAIRVWQTSDWSVNRELDMQLSGQALYQMTFIDFSPSSMQLVAASGGALIKVFDMSSGSILWTQQGQAVGGQPFLTSMDVSPDGQWVAAAVTNLPAVFSLADGKQADLGMQAMGVTSTLAFSPDGKTLALAGYQGSISLREVGSWKEAGSLDAQLSMNSDILYSPDGSRILLPGGYTRAVMELRQVPAGTLLASAEPYTTIVTSISAAAGGSLLTAAYYDGSSRVYKLSDGSILASVPGAGLNYGGNNFIFLSTDEARVLLVSGKDTRIIQVSGGSVQSTFETGTSTYSAAVSPDWQYLAVGTYQGGVQAYRLADGVLLGTMEASSTPVTALAFSADGNLLASGSQDGSVRLWQGGSWTEVRSLQGHTDKVNGLAFSPDGSLLASASDDNTAIVWRTVDGAPMLTLSGHTDGVESVAFSPDGARLATGSRDNTIRLWDAGKGTMLLALEGHTAGVTGLAFIDGGDGLASGSYDGTVRIWDAGK